MKKLIFSHFAALYIGAGLFAGLLMGAALPLNVLGMAYIGATWPAQVYCAPAARGCDAVPNAEISQYLFKASTQAGDQ